MSRSRTAAARRAPLAPRTPRRGSGPVRPVAVPGRPRPATPVVADHAPRAPTLGARVRALPDHRLLDTLLRSRAWIWLLGVALGGIVFMQVSLLGMNAGIGRAVAQSTTLEQHNSALEAQVAKLSSGERIRAAAARLGLLSPDAGSVAFVGIRPSVDARRAVGRMTAPTDAARQALATDGRPAPVVVPVTPVAPAATAVPAAPTATAAPALTPAATVAAPAPVGTTTTTVTSPGAAAAP